MSNLQISSYGREVRGDYISELWLKQVVGTLTKGTNVKIRKGKTWAANPKTKVLTYSDDLKLLNPNQALGLLLHEVGHLKHTTYPDIKNPKCQQYQNLQHEGLNMLEDRRIENKMKSLLPGAHEAIELMNEELTAEVRISQVQATLAYERALAEANRRLEPYTQDTVAPVPLFKSAEELERCANGLTGENPDGPRTQAARRAVHRLPNMVNQVLLEAALQYQGHPPVTKYPLPLIPVLGKKIAEKMKAHKVENLGSTQEVQDFWEKEIFPDLEEWFTPHGSRERTGGQPGGPGDIGGNEYEYKEKMKRKIQELHDRDPEKKEHKHQDGWSYGVMRTLLQPIVKSWAPAFKKVLKDNEARKFLGRHETGRLNKRVLYKARLGDMKVFTRPVESKNKDYSFLLLCDVSGSMQGKPMQEAREAIVLMHEILAFCGINTAVYSFDDSTYEARAFEDKKVLMTKFHKALGDCNYGGTDLSEGLNVTVPKLTKQGTLNKVHITITDGGVDRRSRDLLNEYVRKNPDTEFYGIGVGRYCGDLSTVFPKGKSYNVQDIKDLAPTLIQIMKRRILQA